MMRAIANVESCMRQNEFNRSPRTLCVFARVLSPIREDNMAACCGERTFAVHIWTGSSTPRRANPTVLSERKIAAAGLRPPPPILRSRKSCSVRAIMEAHACASYRVTEVDVYAYPRPAFEQGCTVYEYNLFAMSTRRMGWAVRDGQLSANTLVPVYTANYRLLL